MTFTAWVVLFPCLLRLGPALLPRLRLELPRQIILEHELDRVPRGAHASRKHEDTTRRER